MQGARADELAAILAQLRQGDTEAAAPRAAELLADTPDWPAALHLNGIVAREQGDLASAERLMRQALAAATVVGRERAEYANNLANLLRGAGFPSQAERLYREALAHHDLLASRHGLARTLLELDQPDAALGLLRSARNPDPSLESTLLLSEALAQTGRRQEALDALLPTLKHSDRQPAAFWLALSARLIATGRHEQARKALAALEGSLQAPEALLGLVDLDVLARDWDGARARLAAGIRRFPDHPRMLGRFAEMLWMQGDSRYFADEFRAALARQPGSRPLRAGLASLLRNADRPEEALALLEEGVAVQPKDSVMMSMLAGVALSLSRLDRARSAIADALRISAEMEAVREQAAQVMLALGETNDALVHTAWLVRARPLGQMAWALRSQALRQAGDPLWRRVADPSEVVGVSQLQPPAGHESMAAFNAALGGRLRRLHRLQSHPLLNSVRDGTQVEIDPELETDPVIRLFFDAVRPAVASYIRQMPEDNTHPLYARRQRGYRLSGCWTVRLTAGGGRHQHHVHPRGWISSAYYVDVPAQVTDAPDRAGWLSFGGAPFPAARLEPMAHVRPAAGMLALFPSYLWHGVAPFPGVGERLTMAFDVLPLAD
jgi:predicted Zn-dependent protease